MDDYEHDRMIALAEATGVETAIKLLIGTPQRSAADLLQILLVCRDELLAQAPSPPGPFAPDFAPDRSLSCKSWRP